MTGECYCNGAMSGGLPLPHPRGVMGCTHRLPVARCGSSDPHGYHRLTAKAWCGGNLNVIEAEPPQALTECCGQPFMGPCLVTCINSPDYDRICSCGHDMDDHDQRGDNACNLCDCRP